MKPTTMSRNGLKSIRDAATALLFVAGFCSMVAFSGDPRGTICDDGDPCTNDFLNDMEVCVHEPIDCDDGDPCTIDFCTSQPGEGGTTAVCQHEPINCDDEDPCTVDTCENGVCIHTPMNCDDGDPCTDDLCIDGVCQHFPRTCNDEDRCTVDACVDGVCTHTPFCDDGDPCTDDICNDAPTDGGNGGVQCLHFPRTCDDEDPCTVDTCVDGDCVHTPLDCDDRNPCTEDFCEFDEQRGISVCQHVPLACDDGDPCTIDICTSQPAGQPTEGADVCMHVPIICDDGDPCTEDFCYEGTCMSYPIYCFDRYPCEMGECIDGECVYTPLCNDNNPCTTDICTYQGKGSAVRGEIDPDEYCMYVPVECKDDGDPCTIEACVDGVCTTQPVNCDDEDPCTVDTCDNGECVHTPVDCDDNDPCTIDECNGGECTHTAIVCDDNNDCTSDACVDGECVFTPTDDEPPVITGCPETLTISLTAGCTYTPPEFSIETLASDNCTATADLVVTTDPASLADLALGQTEVTVTVTDASGNQAVCTVMLIIEAGACDQTAPQPIPCTPENEVSLLFTIFFHAPVCGMGCPLMMGCTFLWLVASKRRRRRR